MTNRVYGRTLAAIAAGVLCLVAPAAVSAQTAVVAGRVTSQEGAGIGGATVMIDGTGLASQTDASGEYSISAGARVGQQVVIRVRMIGFSPGQRTVTLAAGTQTVNFVLTADPFRLGEVVVTGVATGTEQRKLPFTVARISEEQVSEVPASSPVSAIAGKVAGVRVTAGTGGPGAAPAIRLRGSTNLAIGGSAPLVIIDGVVSRANISDIDANDIESIEILKGATASSFYGSNAANGVVNITTKRGRNLAEGNVQVISRSEYGRSGIESWVPLNRSHPYRVNPDGEIFLSGGGSRVVESQYHDRPYPTSGPRGWRNQLREWMEEGDFYSSNLQVGVRRGSTNFNSSYTSDHNAGVVPLRSGQYRQNARLNVDQGIGQQLDVSLSMTYGSVKNDHPINALGVAPTGDAWFALLQAPPDIDLRRPWNEPAGRDTIEFWRHLPPVVSPSARGNPLYVLANEDYLLNRERFLGSASGRYRPARWLTLDANYGTDRLSSRERQYQFKGFLTELGNPGNGLLRRNSNNISAYNGQIAATAVGEFFNQINTATRIGTVYEQRSLNFITASTSRLNVAFVPDLAAAARDQVSVDSQDELERNINYVASQTFDIRDRYIIDLMWRRDGSSLFGADNRWKNFYRVSGAWRISEDIDIPRVQELKIRGGRGTAGLRPSFLDQYETYSVSGGQISKLQLGNRNLQPAVQTEDEFGLEITFLERFNLEIVQANRITRGAFLNIPLSLAQSGGFTHQVQNAADVSGRTTEITLQTQVINRPAFSYAITVTGDRTRQRIDRLGRAPFLVGEGNTALGQGQGVYFYKEGEPLGIIYGSRWVRSFAELRENPAFATAAEADFVVNPLGYLVRRASPGALIEYVDAEGENRHIIGNSNPDFNWGLSNNVRWRNFSLYALIDGQRGGDIYNFTKQWMFQDLRHGDMDMAGRPDDQKVPFSVFTQSLYAGLNPSDYFVEDASFVKLRELSVGYNFGDRALRVIGVDRYARNLKVALIGRNLLTWTNYSGFDPDVVAGGDFNFRIDGFRYPNFRTITGQVELTF
jgi:TonB-linked SusC/RagA family outer membrane protein